eukprot:1597286-Rhodomonas_salina.1
MSRVPTRRSDWHHHDPGRDGTTALRSVYENILVLEGKLGVIEDSRCPGRHGGRSLANPLPDSLEVSALAQEDREVPRLMRAGLALSRRVRARASGVPHLQLNGCSLESLLVALVRV